MKTWIEITTLACSALFISTFASAAAGELTSPIAVKPDQAIVQVKGVVCSFCAYGAEKNLSKLNFLDKSQFGDDGVLVNINTHQITLALQSSKKVDLSKIVEAITKGGYDPENIYLNLFGKVTKKNNRYLLTSSSNNQVFELNGENMGQYTNKGLIRVKGFLHADSVLGLKSAQAVPIQVMNEG